MLYVVLDGKLKLHHGRERTWQERNLNDGMEIKDMLKDIGVPVDVPVRLVPVLWLARNHAHATISFVKQTSSEKKII